MLAEVVGLEEGFTEGEVDEPLARQAARLYSPGLGRPGGDSSTLAGILGQHRDPASDRASFPCR